MSERSRRPDPPPELVREIEALLEERLGRFGLDRVEVRAGLDHAGEPALFVDAWYRLSPEPVDVVAQLDAELALLDLLGERGEERRASVRHHLAEGQAVARSARRAGHRHS
ncbi:MAG: hypothetical protein WHV64_11850 [Geminicoccaceae bacterium]